MQYNRCNTTTMNHLATVVARSDVHLCTDHPAHIISTHIAAYIKGNHITPAYINGKYIAPARKTPTCGRVDAQTILCHNCRESMKSIL